MTTPHDDFFPPPLVPPVRSDGRWCTEAAVLDDEVARLRRELAKAKHALYTAQVTHIREAGHDRPVVGDCAVCRVLTSISRDMPSRPDDPEEIRRLAQATTEETTDEH